jgi:hypothetical protein
MKRTKKVVEAVRCTAAELAEMFDLSPARISQLTTQGVFERGADKHYDLTLSLIGYERFLAHPRWFDRLAPPRALDGVAAMTCGQS